ncbi:MAG: winged helix-turn-helix domain-containing protein [Colwellia sp.]|nr:winged helix-turn-helix domain-containing protein [Colwellia sp.]
MFWKFGDFEFNANTRVLSTLSGDAILEPKVSSLLSYLCQHPQRNISRDELFTEVWHDQLVTDNAINRVIALLRKALTDEAKLKQYIVTVPKIGYRFIITPVNITPELQENLSIDAPVFSAKTVDGKEVENQQRPFIKNRLLTILYILITVSLLGYFFIIKSNTIENINPRVSPLTRLSSDQFDAEMANNNQQLIYSSYENKEQALYLMSLPNGAPQKISLPNGRASNGHWSLDDTRVVYLYRNKTTCQFHQIDFINGKAQTPRSIYQCMQNSVTDFAYSNDNQTLYFVERINEYSPYIAYQLNIATGEKRRLAQPTAIGKGNHHFDFSPKIDRFLLLSDQTPGNTTFFEVDLSNNNYKELITFDYFIDNALWAHQANHVVHQAPHPSYQLLKTDLNTQKSSVLVSDTRRINNAKRINNQHDYLFSSYMFNSDIEINKKTVTDFNSSVTDFLPAISNDKQQLAFISKRSGYSKIWLKNLSSDTLSSIEPPKQGRSFYSLQWSFDDKSLLANTSNGLLIFDVQARKVDKTIELPLPAYSVSWITVQELVYSQYQDNHWQLFKYNVATSITTPFAQQWAFSLGNDKQQVLINQEMKIFINDSPALQSLTCKNPIFRQSSTMRLDGDNFYCLSEHNSSELLRLESMTTVHRQAHKMKSMGYYDYAVSGNLQALSKTRNASSDIMRTNF